MATVKDMLMCPKCNKRMMGKAHPQKFGKEYFAHCCHSYFGMAELIHQWGFDAGSLFGDFPSLSIAPINFFSPKYYEIETGEPYWMSGKERNYAYEMVGRMLLGIPELDDYTDLLVTQEDALGIGVQ